MELSNLSMVNVEMRHAFRGAVTEVTIPWEINAIPPVIGLDHYFERCIKPILRTARQNYGCFKIYMVCEAYFQVCCKLDI